MLTKKQLKKLAKDNNLDYDSYHAVYIQGSKDMEKRVKKLVNNLRLDPYTDHMTNHAFYAIHALETSK